MFFTRAFYLEMEIRITFLYEKQFQQMTPFSKELKKFYNWLQQRIKNDVHKYNFFSHARFETGLFLKIKIALTFLYEKEFRQ